MTQHFQPRARDPANIVDRMKSREDKMRSSTKYKITKIHIYASSKGLLRNWETSREQRFTNRGTFQVKEGGALTEFVTKLKFYQIAHALGEYLSQRHEAEE